MEQHEICIIYIIGLSVFHAPAQAINITAAQLNGEETHIRTVVKIQLTWSKAAKYCSDSKLGSMLSGIGTYNILDLRHYMHITQSQWSVGEDLWLGGIKPANETKWFKPSCTILSSPNLDKTAYPSIMCLMLNMTVDSSKFSPYMTSCEEKHFFICTKKKGLYTVDTYTNMTLFDPGGINILTDTKYNTTATTCQARLKQVFAGFVAVYHKENKSCILYRTNPVYFRWNYQLVPVSSHSAVYVKTSGIEYKVTDTLVVPVKPKILNCVPLLGVVKQSTTPTAPVVTSTTTPIDTPTSLNTTMSLCTCHPLTYTVTGGRDFASVIRSLRINKTALSSYKRKRMSIHDDRTSCVVMGYVAAIVIFGKTDDTLFPGSSAVDPPMSPVQNKKAHIRVNKRLY